MNKKLFIGLGNVGPHYENTRHNLGITTLRVWVEHLRQQPDFEVGEWKEDVTGLYSSVPITHYSLLVTSLFPLTMMNNSGQAVAAHLKNNPVESKNIVVIYDDMEVPLGQVEVTPGGSAKGHNGLRSIQTALGTQELTRVRLGIGRPPEGTTAHDFVLGKFPPEDQPLIDQAQAEAVAQLSQRIEKKMSP